MSDLAPFVAAALRDKNVADLKQENDSLRQQLRHQLHKSRAVTITGANGTPVYARAQMEDGEFFQSNEGEHTWKVMFRHANQKVENKDDADDHNDEEDEENNDDEVVPCPPSDFYHAEVRVGGMCVALIRNSGGNRGYFPSNKTVFLLLKPSGNEIVIDIGLGMGPFASESAFEDFHWLFYGEENSNEIVGENPKVSFFGIRFHLHAIRVMIDNFEQLWEEFKQSHDANSNDEDDDDDDDNIEG